MRELGVLHTACKDNKSHKIRLRSYKALASWQIKLLKTLQAECRSSSKDTRSFVKGFKISMSLWNLGLACQVVEEELKPNGMCAWRAAGLNLKAQGVKHTLSRKNCGSGRTMEEGGDKYGSSHVVGLSRFHWLPRLNWVCFYCTQSHFNVLVLRGLFLGYSVQL